MSREPPRPAGFQPAIPTAARRAAARAGAFAAAGVKAVAALRVVALPAVAGLLAAAFLSSCGSLGSGKAGAKGADDTAYLQSLLDSWDETIVIPARKRPWQSDPLFLSVSGKTILFEKGCVIEARKGSFLGKNDCLLTVYDSENVVISGYGAALRMRRDEYASDPYPRAQWRHGIALFTCKNVLVEGLTVEETGGDGVYVGQEKKEYPCENITLRDLRLRKNFRQGVSVIAVKGFLMEGCSVSGTEGNLPMAGIDFEPNKGVYGLTDCVIRDCDFRGNKGAGIQVYLANFGPTHPPVDLLVEKTKSRGNRFSVVVSGLANGATGTVTFRDCDLTWVRQVVMTDAFSVRFE